MRLTKKEIHILLDLLAEVTIVEPSGGFPYRISQRKFGYRPGSTGELQAKLSTMLAAARE